MAAEGSLKLLGLTVSPFVIRVRMALQLKGIGYEYMEQDLFTKGELLRRMAARSRARIDSRWSPPGRGAIAHAMSAPARMT